MRNARLAPPDDARRVRGPPADARRAAGRRAPLARPRPHPREGADRRARRAHLVLPPAPTEAAITEETGAARRRRRRQASRRRLPLRVGEVSERALSCGWCAARWSGGDVRRCGRHRALRRARDLIDLFCAAAPAALGDVRRASLPRRYCWNDCELLGLRASSSVPRWRRRCRRRSTRAPPLSTWRRAGGGAPACSTRWAQRRNCSRPSLRAATSARWARRRRRAPRRPALKRLAHEMKRLRATWGGTLPPATARVHLAALLDAPLGAVGALLALRLRLRLPPSARCSPSCSRSATRCSPPPTPPTPAAAATSRRPAEVRQLAPRRGAPPDLPAVQALHSSGASAPSGRRRCPLGALFAVQSAARAFARLQAAAQAET